MLIFFCKELSKYCTKKEEVYPTTYTTFKQGEIDQIQYIEELHKDKKILTSAEYGNLLAMLLKT